MLLKYASQSKSAVVRNDDGQSVVPATVYGADDEDGRSVVTNRLGAAGPSILRRVAGPPSVHPGPGAACGCLVSTFDPNSRSAKDLNLVTRGFGPGKQLPFAPFLGNPLARLVAEFSPMCLTETHAAIFAHAIRHQLSHYNELALLHERDEVAAAAAAAAAAPAAAAAAVEVD